MSEYQNHLPIKYLEKLKEQRDAGDERQLNDELSRTEAYLERKNRKQHEGKAVLISADALATLLESISELMNGDKPAVNNHVILNNWHFSDRDVVTLLESAIAESEYALKSLDKSQNGEGLYTIENNFEVIGHLTLNDVAYIASEMEVEYEDQNLDFTQLTKVQVDGIMLKVIGEPIGKMREFIADNGDGRAIRDLIRKHVEQSIRTELGIPENNPNENPPVSE